MSKIQAKGSCLCGKVTIETQTLDTDMGVCHCSTCRKWAGGPFMATDAGTDITITGEQNITRYSSSEWADRGTCKNCGTSLFYYLKPKNQYIVSVGLFDKVDFYFDNEIFIDEQPSFYCFANKTKQLTGEEVFAAATAEE